MDQLDFWRKLVEQPSYDAFWADLDLADNVEAVRANVRRFAAIEIAPHVSELDRANQFALERWPKPGAMGVLGITAAEEPTRAKPRWGRRMRVVIGACPCR